MAKKVWETVNKNDGLWGSIAAGAILGFVIGGTVALLYAPKSGRELRGDLEDAADDIKSRAEEALDDLGERAAEIAQSSRTLLEETRENLIRSMEAGREAYEDDGGRR